MDSLGRAGKFSFVDGLTGLLSGGQGSESTADRGRVLKSGKLDDMRRSIEAAITDVRSGPKVLIVDQLDELLAIFGEEDVTGLALEGMLLSLREVSFRTDITGPLPPRTKLHKANLHIITACSRNSPYLLRR